MGAEAQIHPEAMEMIGTGVSVIICTYNGNSRLGETLRHLAAQRLKCAAEIVLVDNASEDGTREFAEHWWKEHGKPVMELRTFYQPIPGKSFAQEMGYAEASYEYFLICDDDNWLASDYIQTAFEIMEANPEIGALGGRCSAAFETEEPEWWDQYAGYYAVAAQGDRSGDITGDKGCLYGAGMVIRRSDWENLGQLGFSPELTCRKGNTLSSGGDTEYSYCLRLLGKKIWYDDRLHFVHYMTTGRLNLNYLSRLRKALSDSNFILSAYLDELNQIHPTKADFREKVKTAVRSRSFKSRLKHRVFGDYEQKEQAKAYFRRLWNLWNGYPRYAQVRESIANWKPR